VRLTIRRRRRRTSIRLEIRALVLTVELLDGSGGVYRPKRAASCMSLMEHLHNDQKAQQWHSGRIVARCPVRRRAGLNAKADPPSFAWATDRGLMFTGKGTCEWSTISRGRKRSWSSSKNSFGYLGSSSPRARPGLFLTRGFRKNLIWDCYRRGFVTRQTES
jgi:hypothetical protein